MTIGERIRARRKELGLSVDDLAQKLGKNRATIYRYESNEIENLPTTILEPLARALLTTPAALMGWDQRSLDGHESKSNRKIARIPVLGRVAAGVPIEAIEHVEDYEEMYIPTAEDPHDYFALRIVGHSMEPRIWDGDIVIVRKQSDVDSGKIAVVLVNGDDATVKQIKKSSAGITLIGYNVDVYPPHFYSNEEIESLPVVVLGKVVELRRPL